jgi:hypothetical protein
MKVKRVCFGEDSRDTIKVPGFPGRHQELHVGKVGDPSRDNPIRCEITALDFDQRSGALMIHKKPHDPVDPSSPVNPGREWNIGQAENQRCEADFCILMVPDKTTVYGDDPMPSAAPEAITAAGGVQAALAKEKAAEEKRAQGEGENTHPHLTPPPAKPVEKPQGQQRR